jgi:hypothetical protein
LPDGLRNPVVPDGLPDASVPDGVRDGDPNHLGGLLLLQITVLGGSGTSA